MEKFMTFTVGNLKFIDSFQFLASSLSRLADNLQDRDFIYTAKYYTDPVQFNLMKQKGDIRHMNHIDSFSKFDCTELPPKEAFYSKLTKTHISEERLQSCKKCLE